MRTRAHFADTLARILAIALVTCGSAHLVHAEDFTDLGGELTSDFPGRFAIQLPGPNVTDESRRETMLAGFSVFHRIFTKQDGVGPRFVNDSCAGCHVENGRGAVGFVDDALTFSSMIIKVSRPGLNPDGSARTIQSIGEQLQNHSLSSARSLYDIKLSWRAQRSRYSDGTVVKLRKPVLTFSIPATNSSRLRRSLRMTPAVIGVGLVEAIPDQQILERHDPDDTNQDGISGRARYVSDLRRGGTAIGRFGFKASNPTVEQQTLAAFFFDMGVTNELFNLPSQAAIEFSGTEQTQLLFYQKLAGVPAARDQSSTAVQAGYQNFVDVGCESCHRSTFVTSSSEDVELNGQTIHPFSDFLLHDMGRELADGRPEAGASGTEWRTAPLWGLGFAETISRIVPRFLHDGRARTIEEAILWHAGEAEASRDAFQALSAEKREELLTFLRSL